MFNSATPETAHDDDRDLWEWFRFWWKDYDPTSRREQTEDPLRKLQDQWRIGPIAADIWCWAWPITELLGWSGPIEKLLEIDIAADPHYEPTSRYRMRVNVEKILDPVWYVAIRNFMSICHFLWLPFDASTPKEQFDTMFFSEILNYVDYVRVLEWCSQYLKSWGRFIIFGKPGRGYGWLFDQENGLKCNDKLINELERIWFSIEWMHYSWEAYHDSEGRDVSKVMIVAVKK